MLRRGGFVQVVPADYREVGSPACSGAAEEAMKPPRPVKSNISSPRPNPSIEGTFQRPLRALLPTAHVERCVPQGHTRSMLPFLAFLLAAVVLAVTPGPGIAYVVARTAAGGRAEGLASCAGTGIGGLFHVCAAALGLSVLLAQSATAFTVVKYFGAAYLLYLGVRLLLAKAPAAAGPVTPGGVRRALLEGVLVEALNVKTALFFLAFLPQFLVSSNSPVPQLVVMGTVCVLLNTLVDVGAVFGAARLLQAGHAARRRARVLNKVSGITLVGLSLYVAAARRGT